MEKQYNDKYCKGFYQILLQLQTEYPTAQNGDYALVAETGTFWAWFNKQWNNTGSNVAPDAIQPNLQSVDNTNPQHYQLAIQPIDYIIKNNLDFLEGNIIKYVSRYKQKNGLEDLLKAKKYLELLIEKEEKK